MVKVKKKSTKNIAVRRGGLMNTSIRILVADVVKPDMGESDSKKSIETWLKTSLAFRNVITLATLHRFACSKK